MSVSVTSRRMDDAHQPQFPLPHTVTPPSPDASAGAHSAFSSSSSLSLQPSPQQRRPSKPVEEYKQAEPQLIQRVSSTSTVVSYSSSSLSSNIQPQHYSAHIHDTSHHAVVSFAPLPGITAMHAAPQHQPPTSNTQSLPSAAHLNATASTASQSSSTSYLPPTHLVHAHSDTEEGEEEGEEEGAVGEEGEYEDEDGEDEDSVDDSPRDGRILTFADEHGVQLCAFYVYDPTAIQNVTPRVEKQAGAGGGGGGGSGGESDRRKEGGGKVARAADRASTDAEANCQCCIS